MAHDRITLKTVQSLKAQAAQKQKAIIAWDDSLRHAGHKGSFGVRVSPSGHVSWQVQRWQGGRGGKAQRHSFEAASLDDARQKAVTMAADVAGGADLPQRARQKRQAKREALTASTLSEAVDLYFAHHSQPDSRYWDELRKRYDREIIPHLGGKDTRLPQITKRELRAMINAKKVVHPTGARLLYAALSPFFKWCVSEELIEHSPLSGIAPPKPSEKRTRILTDNELKAFWQATQADTLYGPFYRLLLLTMQRRTEVSAMAWCEIDKAERLWTIPGERTKNGHAHLVPLSPQAMEVIESIKPVDGCPYVFGVAGYKAKWTTITDYSGAKERLDAQMPKGTSPWRVHDLRRTGRTALAKARVPREVAEKVLNHVPADKLEAVYNLHEYLDERRSALDSWGLLLDRLTGNFSARFSNVVRLKRETA